MVPGIRPFFTEEGLYFNLIYINILNMLFQIALDTKTLIAYKAVVWFFCTVLQGMCVRVLLSLEVFITYVTMVVFLLHMNSFCLALEVISTSESIPCMRKYVPFKVTLCKEMFIALNAWILW